MSCKPAFSPFSGWTCSLRVMSLSTSHWHSSKTLRGTWSHASRDKKRSLAANKGRQAPMLLLFLELSFIEKTQETIFFKDNPHAKQSTINGLKSSGKGVQYIKQKGLVSAKFPNRSSGFKTNTSPVKLSPALLLVELVLHANQGRVHCLPL